MDFAQATGPPLRQELEDRIRCDREGRPGKEILIRRMEFGGEEGACTDGPFLTDG